MGMYIFNSFQGLCYLEMRLWVPPLIWFWLMRCGSSPPSSSGTSSELGSTSRMEKFSGISWIKGSIAWLCLFNVLKSFVTCGFKSPKDWERVAWWLFYSVKPQYEVCLAIFFINQIWTISCILYNIWRWMSIWHHWPGPFLLNSVSRLKIKVPKECFHHNAIRTIFGSPTNFSLNYFFLNAKNILKN